MQRLGLCGEVFGWLLGCAGGSNRKRWRIGVRFVKTWASRKVRCEGCRCLLLELFSQSHVSFDAVHVRELEAVVWKESWCWVGVEEGTLQTRLPISTCQCVRSVIISLQLTHIVCGTEAWWMGTADSKSLLVGDRYSIASDRAACHVPGMLLDFHHNETGKWLSVVQSTRNLTFHSFLYVSAFAWLWLRWLLCWFFV